MDERDKRWWLQPLSYGYVGPQAVATGLLQQTGASYRTSNRTGASWSFTNL